MLDSDIPDEYWKATCDEIDYPLACISTNNKFIWVNTAFEKLVGYSIAQLIDREWMEITKQSDVGGDLASVNAVMKGKITHYTMSKSYIHKRGHLIPVELTVRRFPRSLTENIICFIVEASPAKATRPELEEMQNKLEGMISELRKRIEDDEKGIEVNVGNIENRRAGGDIVGRDKNSDNAIKFMASALAVMCIVVAWLIYYVATTGKQQMPVQPSPEVKIPLE